MMPKPLPALGIVTTKVRWAEPRVRGRVFVMHSLSGPKVLQSHAFCSTLILTQDITVEAFVCPSSNNAVPPGAAQMTPDQLADWVNKNSNYIYGGGGLRNDAPAEKIILIEKLDDHDGDGMNCLFGDGHVEVLLPNDPRWPEVNELLKQGK